MVGGGIVRGVVGQGGGKVAHRAECCTRTQGPCGVCVCVWDGDCGEGLSGNVA